MKKSIRSLYQIIIFNTIFWFTSCTSVASNLLLVFQFQPKDTGLYAASDENIEWYKKQKQDELLFDEYITAADGAKLRALNLKAKEPSKTVILSVHGWSKGAYTQLFKFAKPFSQELGVNVVAPDLRNFGQSEGTVNGWGIFDKDDLLLWINKVIEWYGDDCNIFLHGLSLGGTAVLYTASFDLPKNVVGVISDAAVLSFRDIACWQLSRFRKDEEKNQIFVDKMQDYFNKFEGSYDLDLISLYNHLERIKLPTLFIYSKTDEFVPAWSHERIIALTNSEKQIWAVPKCSHDQIIVRFQDEYIAQVKEFIDSCISNN